MSEKEKVMTVTLMRSDLFDVPAYIGAQLTLPAENGEIQDALHRARITGNQPYQFVECLNIHGEELSFIPDNPSLAELNFLAGRISALSVHDRIAFTGCAMIGNGHPTMQTLINITYNLENVHIIKAKNDRELGKFYIDNDFVDAFNHIPPEYQEEVIELLDMEKVGRIRREAEGGIYLNGIYVVNDSGNQEQVYDAIRLPEMPEEHSYIFKLQLAQASFDLDNAEPEHCVTLQLPATDKEILAALEQLGTASLDECVFYHCESPIPALEQAFSFSEDIDKMNFLAGCIHELGDKEELPKFKAALEAVGCADIDQVLDLTQNLDCYDFYEMLSLEDYGEEIIRKHGLETSDHAFALFDFGDLGERMMHKDGLLQTNYGVIRRNEKEMVLEYSSPQLGQQML
jgi:hypothetical protein